MSFAVALAVFVLGTQLLAYPKARAYSVEPVVDWILANADSAPTRILAPPDLEGPIIAEFATRAPARMSLEIRRPSKLFSTSDWIGRKYESHFASPEKLMSYLSEYPVDLLIWHGIHPHNAPQHEHVMQSMLASNPERWRLLTRLPSNAQDPQPWMVYAFVP